MSKKRSGTGKFVFGAAIGAALGMLFAPKSGKQNRIALKKKTDELIEKVKEIDVEDVKESFNNKIDQLVSELEDLDKEKAVALAKKKAKELKKHADELVSYAKEKGTPIIEKAADEVKNKAIEVTKVVLEKLESEK
ncbi:MAG: YtxH domain-containing protein [Bacilli bacterium]